MLDLWKATKPDSNEHRLALTINFSNSESIRLKSHGGRYVREAHTTIRNLLRDTRPTAIVVIVERNKRLTQTPTGFSTDLHAHGWMVIKKTTTAKNLQAALYDRSSPKITASSEILIQDTYVDQSTSKVKPLDTGWVRYISKDFGRTPTGCKRPTHFFSASKQTKSTARRLREHRITRLNSLIRVFKREDRMIKRNEGEWKHFSNGNSDYYIQME